MNGIIQLKLAYKRQSKKELFFSLFRRRRELEPCRLYHRWVVVDIRSINVYYTFTSGNSYYECKDCKDRKCNSLIFLGETSLLKKDITTELIKEYERNNSELFKFGFNVDWLMYEK